MTTLAAGNVAAAPFTIGSKALLAAQTYLTASTGFAVVSSAKRLADGDGSSLDVVTILLGVKGLVNTGVIGVSKAVNGGGITDVVIDSVKYPQSARNVLDAQAQGKPDVLTINRSGASQNRKDSLRGIRTVPGKDRDEYPPAVTQEGGSGAFVRPIDRGDNRGSGGSLGQQIKSLPNGTQIRIIVKP